MTTEVKNKKSFLESCKDYFIGFVDFKSTTSRSGYWWAYLMIILMYIIPLFINSYLTLMVCTVLFFPTTAIFVRRLHDVGFKTWQAMVLFYIRLILSTIVISVLLQIYILYSTIQFMSLSSIMSILGSGVIATGCIFIVIIICIEVLLILPTNFLHKNKKEQ